MEPGIQTPDETLTKKSGSCRDSAWLLVQLLRHLGPGGSLRIRLPDPAQARCEVAGRTVRRTADFADLHAWCEVYLPGAGWVGLDPTSGLFAGEGHIPLACTANPPRPRRSAARSSRAKCYSNSRCGRRGCKETPRVTKPYSEEQWRDIEALGDRVDAGLKSHDVRLTMGGEPTFISDRRPSGAEWHIAAVGPTKRALADGLIRRLRDRFAPGGLLHYGQGKWYPGKSCRAGPSPSTGAPTASRYGRMQTASRRKRPMTSPTAEDALTLTQAIARRLGIASSYAIPAYEDFWHHWARNGPWRSMSIPQLQTG